MARPEAALNRLAPIYDGAVAGHYTLPDDVATARTAFLAILEANRRSAALVEPLDPRLIEQRAIEAIFESADAGQLLFDPEKPPQWTADMLAAQQEQQAREAEARALRHASEVAADRLTTTMEDSTDIFIEGHLRPALEQTVEAVVALMPKAAAIPWEQPERVVSMSAATRATWEEMTKAAARYQSIRRTQETLWRITEQLDTGLWRLIEMRYLYKVWPTAGTWQEQARPWPSDTRARLLWLVQHREEAGLWMPTVAEAYRAMGEQRQVLSQRLAHVPVSAGPAGR
jgi:hypothetical protein